MGIMTCDRNGCENIMCDRINHTFGYICYECFNELKGKEPKTWEEVKIFMDTPKFDSKDTKYMLDLDEIFVEIE